MITITADGKPEHYTCSKNQARKACRKANKKGDSTWEMHIIRPLPDVDMVMTATPKVWDKIRCPGCGAILNTDGNFVSLSGKSMKVEFSDYSKLIDNIRKLRDFHVDEARTTPSKGNANGFHRYAQNVLSEILGVIETTQAR